MAPYDVILALPCLFTDHPSFPEALLKRSLEASGFSVGVLQQPAWHSAEAFRSLGAPRLFFAIVPGPVDSMVLNYTANGKRRKEDLYQGDGGCYFPHSKPSVSSRIRPDRTVIVFANRMREAFRDIPIVIGGIEASQRRLVHYDFQQRKLRRSILADSRADLLVIGMGEAQIVAIARAANQGAVLRELAIPGTASLQASMPTGNDVCVLPDQEAMEANPSLLVQATRDQERALRSGQLVVQRCGTRFVVVRPTHSWAGEELDSIYGLPYTRSHPLYQGYSPALRMNLFSITSHRGCLGRCAFCAVSSHQGTRIVSRSISSIISEVNTLFRHPQWKGIISDVGGPSAEMYGADCPRTDCGHEACLGEQGCGQAWNGEPYRELLRTIRTRPGVRKLLLGSGVRYDLMLHNPGLLEDIMRHHAGRFLRVAPEHSATRPLQLMGKSSAYEFGEFVKLFRTINRHLTRPIALAPYLMVGHPGETDQDVHSLADALQRWKLQAPDVQIFTPTPGTLSTAMYYAGCDSSAHPVAVERNMARLEARKRLLLSQ